jgi:hypothetical protein
LSVGVRETDGDRSAREVWIRQTFVHDPRGSDTVEIA